MGKSMALANQETSCECAPKLNARLMQRRTEVMARKGSWVPDPHPFARDVALWKAWRTGMSPVQIRANLLLELVQDAKLLIPAGWALAGEHLAGHGFGLGSEENRTKHLARLQELGVPVEKFPDVVSCFERWCNREQLYAAIGEPLADNTAESGNWGRGMVYWSMGWIENHSIRDYAKVLRFGYAGIKAEIDAHLQAADISAPDFPRQENFWKAGLAVCDAGIALGRRYAELAAKLAGETTDPDQKARFEQMAAACANVPARGAKTLFEAVQSFWLAHILTCGEDGINANSIGRLDQILQPYFKADRKAGRTTEAAALELMEELALKLYLDYEVQAICLGGVDARGKNAVNTMTHLILDSARNVGFVRDISVRLHKESPPDLVRKCAEMIAQGGGIPFFFNDDCFLKALNDRGIPLKDARDYAPIGCIELTIPGKANPHAVSGWINAAKCLELALFNGQDPRTGEQFGPATGDLTTMKSYDELWANYRKQLEFFSKRMVYFCNRRELAQRERGPLPCWSILTDDCIARGRDITDNGAKYMYHEVCFMGTANTADSLCAIRKLVFEEKKIAPAALLAALKSDFAGQESLRQMLLTGAPKYGNDAPEVDEIAVRVTNDFIDLMDTFHSALGGRYFVHLFTFLCNIAFGKGLGATPDGRRAGEPLAYSLSAHQGRDVNGVTALLRSLARLPHNRAAGATAAIIDLDPKLVEGEAGITRLAQLITAAIRMGIGQMQFNVVTAERLRQAQADPEHYGNLPVRVAGYSQMFKLLTPELQEHVIARHKHTE